MHVHMYICKYIYIYIYQYTHLTPSSCTRRRTIQSEDHLTRPHAGILNNHVAMDKASIRGTGLTSTHNRILNTRVPVTSPTLAD